MVTTRDLIIRFKAVKEARHLSYGDILNLVEANGEHISKTSIARIFAKDSEEKSFMQETLMPIANALLGKEDAPSFQTEYFIEFLIHQITKKDEWIDILLKSTQSVSK